jgi:hypothetical protein
MRTVDSKDGTVIAFDLSGRGPTVILVAPAFGTRADQASLACWPRKRGATMSQWDAMQPDRFEAPPPGYVVMQVAQHAAPVDDDEQPGDGARLRRSSAGGHHRCRPGGARPPAGRPGAGAARGGGLSTHAGDAGALGAVRPVRCAWGRGETPCGSTTTRHGPLCGSSSGCAGSSEPHGRRTRGAAE